MLAIVKTSLSIRGPLQYNEQKVTQQQARFLDARNFLQEKEELTMRHKLQRFQDLAALNERSTKKAVHISVNFPATDQLSDGRMARIAAEFMQGIGFADQPWLVYRHIDAGHPHMHIVTTNIRPDGSRILNDLRSPYHLKQLCWQLETSHGLTPAIPMPDLFGQEQVPEQKQVQQQVQRLTYGEKPTKTAIAEVLHYVNRHYAFTSIEAYNAVLSLYHVRADRGREDSAMYQKRGLYYRMIDGEGRKLGAPIKASAFRLPVTIDKLEQKYRLSHEQVRESMRRVCTYVDFNLLNIPTPYSLLIFRKKMAQEKILVVIPALTQRPTRGPKPRDVAPKPDDGHGIFYVDTQSMTVMRDTELGQRYTAAALLQRTGLEKELRLLYEQKQLQIPRRSDAAALRPDYPDAAETRRVLFKLSSQQNEIVERQLVVQRQKRVQRRSQRQRPSW